MCMGNIHVFIKFGKDTLQLLLIFIGLR